MTLINVRDANGKVWLVDPTNLKDPNEPTQPNTIGVTNDNQLYQLVGGIWYRLLRTAKVDFATVIAPYGQDKFQLNFALGRDVNYTD